MVSVFGSWKPFLKADNELSPTAFAARIAMSLTMEDLERSSVGVL